MLSSTLAIHGGAPVIAEGPPAWPITTDAIRDSVSAAIEDGSWGRYEARWTETLCEKLSERFQPEGIGRPNVLLCCSGTIAVELALRGAGVVAGDEVILAGYDFPGNFRAIEAIGARPVLVDVVKSGWVIDPELVGGAVSEKTAAIIVSHLHGQIAPIKQIRAALVSSMFDLKVNSLELTGKKIVLIEDNCQAPGGLSSGQPLGSLGDISVLSFGGSKLLSAGRGGAIVTTSDSVARRARIFSARGNEAFPLSQLQAAALLPQLNTLDEFTVCRNESARVLNGRLAAEPRLGPLQQIAIDDDGETLPAFYKLPWLLHSKPDDWGREEFIAAVQAEGVAIDSAFRGFTRRSERRCRKPVPLANSQIAAQRTILLHHPVLLGNESNVRKVADAIEKVLDCRRNL